MSRPLTFSLGGVTLTVWSALELSMTYEEFGGFTRLRTANGGGIAQQNWSKWRVSISGQGQIPLGLELLDYTQPMTLKCTSPMVRQATGADGIELPTWRRADVPLEAYAFRNLTEELVARTVALAPMETDIYDVQTLSGAIGYRINFWPEFTVLADRPSIDNNRRDSTISWSLTAEEQ